MATLLGSQVERPLASIPRSGPCPHPAKTVASWRVCPCVADLRVWKEQFPEVSGLPLVQAGLPVIQVAICDEHVRYFMEYVEYPFICSGCGVSFLHPGEVLLDGAEIFED